MGELINMSKKEIDRYHILKQIVDKNITQKQGAKLLNLTPRQVRNLLKKLKKRGVEGLISCCRGKSSNHHKSKEFKQSILHLVKTKYEGFGPTLAKEKLEEFDKLKISVEALRLWMIESELWVPRKRRRKKHLPRQRRPCFGELIQADGSHHRWFGEDHPMANLNVLIDDATSTITSLHFSETETLNSYFQAFEKHFIKYGLPRAFYTDRFSVFKSHKENGSTHMQKSLKLLDVELILANSPQAKGRVERTNRTLQDRLLKELKLKGITNIDDANAFVPKFIDEYNNKFSKKPMSSFDAHRPLEGYDLNRVLCRYEERTLISGSLFQYNNSFYKVQDIAGVRKMKGRKVEVRVDKMGQMRVFYKDKELKVERLDKITEQPLTLSRKEILSWTPEGKDLRKNIPPFKRYGYKLLNKGEKI